MTTATTPIRTPDLIGPALDWAVAKCDGVHAGCRRGYCYTWDEEGRVHYSPSTDWFHAGPIIERERIQLTPVDDKGTWEAGMMWKQGCDDYTGLTPLIAAMRCFVASKLGDVVEIPNELLPKE